MTKKSVYIIHGWTYTLDKWDELIALLEKQGRTVHMLHVPGLTRESEEVWDVPKYVEWLRSELADVKNPVVIGHSNGGRIAMAYDVAFPKHIARLILIASAGVPRQETKVSWKRRVSKPLAAILKPFIGVRLRRKLYHVIGASDYGNATPNMRETMKQLWAHDTTFDLSSVTAQATLIWGEHDRATPLPDGQTILNALPHADDLHVIHGAAHSPHADDPKRVADIITTVIKES